MNRLDAVEPEIIDHLLSLPTAQQQSSFLRAEDLLHADGLTSLLDIAVHLVRDDPGKARHVAGAAPGLLKALASLSSPRVQPTSSLRRTPSKAS